MHLFVFTRELLQAIRWRSKYNGCVKESENKVEGLSPRLKAPVKLVFFFLLSQRSRKCFAIYMFAEKKTCFDVLCTCKATSLSKMARLVWRYSDDAGAIIENVYKFCMEEKKSGMKLSLNRVWDRTAPSSASKVSLNDLDQGDVRRTIVRRRFCQPLITSEQSSNRVLVTLAARVSFAKISFIRSLLTHAVG